MLEPELQLGQGFALAKWRRDRDAFRGTIRFSAMSRDLSG